MSWGLTGSPRFRRCNPICNPTRHNRPLLGDISRNETQENVLVSGTEETPTTPAVMAATDFQVPVSERMWGFKSPLAHRKSCRSEGVPGPFKGQSSTRLLPELSPSRFARVVLHAVGVNQS